jgi:hypothetical protein
MKKMSDAEIIVDRTNESGGGHQEIAVVFPDNHKVRFWLMGLSDEEYIRRAKIIRENENKEAVNYRAAGLL